MPALHAYLWQKNMPRRNHLCILWPVRRSKRSSSSYMHQRRSAATYRRNVVHTEGVDQLVIVNAALSRFDRPGIDLLVLYG